MFMMKCMGSSSSGNGYAICSDNEIILLECGVREKDMLKAIDYKTKNVVGCLISHEHG